MLKKRAIDRNRLPHMDTTWSGASRVSAERGRHGLERSLGLGAIGAAGLGHVGPAATALAAQRLGRHAHQLDSREAAYEVLGDGHDGAGLAILRYADQGDDARNGGLLALVGEALEVARLDAGDDAAKEFHA